MRAQHAIGIVAIILIGFGLKLTFFSTPSADANAHLNESVRMDVFHMQQSIKNLPEQKMHDMTFVFSEGD
jgi:hypothetical protein